jgi:hypothetical protein
VKVAPTRGFARACGKNCPRSACPCVTAAYNQEHLSLLNCIARLTCFAVSALGSSGSQRFEEKGPVRSNPLCRAHPSKLHVLWLAFDIFDAFSSSNRTGTKILFGCLYSYILALLIARLKGPNNPPSGPDAGRG